MRLLHTIHGRTIYVWAFELLFFSTATVRIIPLMRYTYIPRISPHFLFPFTPCAYSTFSAGPVAVVLHHRRHNRIICALLHIHPPTQRYKRPGPAEPAPHHTNTHTHTLDKVNLLQQEQHKKER